MWLESHGACRTAALRAVSVDACSCVVSSDTGTGEGLSAWWSRWEVFLNPFLYVLLVLHRYRPMAVSYVKTQPEHSNHGTEGARAVPRFRVSCQSFLACFLPSFVDVL